jgi:TRAP-type C4-dicarboxylate transport system substrate-binding protein
MLDLPLANSNGAVLLSRKQYDKISPDQQKILKDVSREYLGKLTALSRQDNEKSLKLIEDAGIKFTRIADQNQIAKFYETGEEARQSLVGKLFDQELLDRVEKRLDDYRNSKKAE